MKADLSDNLILIGMPASGKSTIGVILAKILGYDFLDTDLLIQKAAGKRLEEIIEERGVDGFLTLENEICANLTAERSVIATGGSVVYGRGAMENLQKLGRIIYLHTEYPVLERRLRNIRQRGVVLRDGQTLQELYDTRTRLYEQYADLTVREERGEIEDTVDRICKVLEEVGRQQDDL